MIETAFWILLSVVAFAVDDPLRPGEAPGGTSPAPSTILSPAERARTEAEAQAQSSEADRRFKAGDFSGALPLYRAERASRQKLGDRRYEAYAARAEGCCLSALGDEDAAIAVWTQAAKLDAGRDDPGFEGYDWLLIGQSHLRRKRPEAARLALERALPRLTQAVDRDHEIDARLLLTTALLAQDRADQALLHAKKADNLARELNDPPRIAAAQMTLGQVYRHRREFGTAAERLRDAANQYKTLGRDADAAGSLRLYGETLADLGSLEGAIGALESACKSYKALGDNPALAECLDLVAAVKADAGSLGKAVESAKRAVEIRRELGVPEDLVDSTVALARYLSLQGAWEQAAERLSDVLKDTREDLTPARHVRLLVLLSGVERRAGRSEPAARQLKEAETVAARSGNGALQQIVREAAQASPRPR